MNTFVLVNFNKEFTYSTCKFHGLQTENDLHYRLNCSIIAGPYKGQNSTVTSDTVIVKFNPIPDKPPMTYNFTVAATNTTFTVLVDGTFMLTGQCPNTSERVCTIHVFTISCQMHHRLQSVKKCLVLHLELWE